MSKSAGNTILLSDSPEEIARRMRTAVTDPQKIRKGDPGRPDVCLVFTYHQKFNHSETPVIEQGCRSGALGCVDCKLNAGKRITEHLAPFREKRAYFEAHKHEVTDILHDGESRAKKVAEKTMSEVHTAMKLG